jgi:Zn-dependent protease
MEFNLVQTIAIYALPVIFAITLHEAAHGYVARYFGDTTAYVLGRVSLNPLRHTKPVPVNFNALRNPKRDMLWVAAAGPAANLVMAVAWGLLLKLATVLPQGAFTLPLGLMAEAGIMVNAVLMVLNLLPILPLDGGRIAMSLLPRRLAYGFSRTEPFGFPILLLLIFTNVLGVIMMPMVRASIGLIEAILQL